jgi:Sulfotransferase family
MLTMAVPSQSSSAPAVGSSRVPDFFIVGHHKSGTTALYEMLRVHPQIFLPELKEPRYLASDMRSRFRYPREPRHPETLEEYLALFTNADPDQRVGEASATYLWSHTAAERIAELRSDARIIAILREPASFLRSLHLTFVRGHVESQTSFARAMALEESRREGKRIPRRSHLPQLLQYSDHVRYVDQLRRYRDRFPQEQMLVLIYDDFLADNDATVRAVHRFLEVDERNVESLAVNVTKRYVRSQQVDDLVYSVTMGRGALSRSAKAAIKAVAPQALRHRAMSTIRRRVVLADAPPADERFMLELRRRFKGEVVALSEYLDRDLVALWGYDDVE